MKLFAFGPFALLALSLLSLLNPGCGLAAQPLRVASFRCDATPPLGEAMLWATKLLKVEAPLLAKGIVLEEGTNRFVLCSFDWCLMGNETHSSLRRVLAEAAATSPERVALHCLHQHAAPYADEGAFRLLDGATNPPIHLSGPFMARVRSSLTEALSQACSRLELCDQVGTGQAKVERVASERRVRDEQGKIQTRYSNGAKNPKMAQAPEGFIDPFLKTITFAHGAKPLVRLHYYATHPQTFCCDGRASWDLVGAAREALETQEGVPQLYFTGCAGDVTVGKYNDGSAQALADLTQRLQAGMKAAVAATHFEAVGPLTWRTDSIVFPLRAPKEQVVGESRAWLHNPTQGESLRVYRGAMRLAYIERLNRPVEVSSLQIGSLFILNLPGEPMLAFQMFAQKAQPQAFVAVAGYGECGPAYICTDKAIAEGSYEPEASNVGPGSEALLKGAISRLLGVQPPAK